MEETIEKEAKIGGLLEGTRRGEVFQDRDHDEVECADDLQVMIDVAAVVATMIELVEVRHNIQIHVTVIVALARRRDVITDGAHNLRDDDHDLPEDAHHLREEDRGEDHLCGTLDDVLDHSDDDLALL